MKLSELLAACPAGSDPEILFLHDWGELAPARLLDPDQLAPGDPVIDYLAEIPSCVLIITADPPA